MNTISTDFQFLVENDATPLLLFNQQGKIAYLNKSAEILLGCCKSSEIYELALLYAPKSFGSKVTYIDLVYKLFKFYAINVLYNSEDEIAIYLYNKPIEFKNDITFKGFISTDINTLLQANIELFRMEYRGEFSLLADFDLPNIQINQNNFSLLLRKIFEGCKSATKIDVKLTIKIGEYIRIEEQRYPILKLEIKSDNRERDLDEKIEVLANQNYINTFLSDQFLVLEIPFIRD